MPTQENDLKTSMSFAASQRPCDAATLIVVRRDGPEPRIFMGQRHGGHKFMPNMYVFPGGRLDPDDSFVRPGRDLESHVLAKLQVRMRGRPSAARARGLALAAVRETFEEAGFIIGTPHNGITPPRRHGWQSFAAAGYTPDLSGLAYFARAITPPGRTRRFDTRFFVADASVIANLDAPVAPDPGELLKPAWFTFDEALGLELPYITRDVLLRLRPAVDRFAAGHPVTFQYMKRKAWVIEEL